MLYNQIIYSLGLCCVYMENNNKYLYSNRLKILDGLEKKNVLSITKVNN